MVHTISGQRRVALIDDDPVVRTSVGAILSREGYTPQEYASGEEALAAMPAAIPDLVLLDIRMPGLDGFEVFEQMRKIPSLAEVPVIFLTASKDQDTILRLFRKGADDYLGKPLRSFELLARLRLHMDLCAQAATLAEADLEITQLRRKLLSGELERPDAFSEIVTQSRQMHSIFQYIEAVGPSSRPVMITGETGTGKELVARAIHRISGRGGALVAVNVAGLDDNLFSDTLFGHEKGAYTGAHQARSGMVEKANDGTLFLDEVGDLPPAAQVKLLRLLQENEYFPLGGDRPRHSNARVLVATNQDIESLMSAAKFRNDLYYRLNTHRVHLPPLRMRRGDIPLLAQKFAADAAAQLQQSPPEIDEKTLAMLRSADFPGNVRQLEAAVFDAVSAAAGNQLTAGHFRGLSMSEFDAVAPSNGGELLGALGALRELPTLADAQQALVKTALERTGGNITRASAILGISRQALHKRKNADRNATL
ncbi:MAG: sigma-54-dependent transcriptional regulator [Verrucomicrobiota bacterium]